MSTNRLLGELQEKKLQEVEPTHSVCCCCGVPMPCEAQCAAIRNKTVKAMEKGIENNNKHKRINEVSYYYLVNKQGEKCTFYEAVAWSVMLIGVTLSFSLLLNEIIKMCSYSRDTRDNSFSICEEGSSLFMITSFAFAISAISPTLHLIPNVFNTRRYKETKNGCEEWLKKKVSPDCLNNIKKIPNHTLGSLFKLKNTLKKENIDTVVLDQKITSKQNKQTK